MPIQRSLNLPTILDQEFQQIDVAVMRCAYAAHNTFGHLFQEHIYENDVAARLRAEGFEVHTQVPLMVTHGSFQKIYYLDLVVNGMLYELKAASGITSEHEMQALHYAMLQDVRLVKLLNFGGPQVIGKLLPNALYGQNRQQATIRNAGWHPLSGHCEHLVEQLKALIKDLGTHLDVRLYNEAMVHFFGGEENCLQRVNMCVEGQSRGTHLMQFHSPHHAFVITCFKEAQPNYQRHLEVQLRHVPELAGIQWINLNQSRVEITTVTKS